MNWYSKPRSALGRFLDKHKITQEELSSKSGVTRSTVSRLCSLDSVSPTTKNSNRIVKALRRLTGKRIDSTDFWT
ncbi:helix-turn-helix transcriptional regulator [Bacillus pseudomycoides]|uniref:helix-turn-helix domain-containing protein n=1 Tax=Bacillus pseudomycoides TaxID=64104 RepID=UPI00215B251C|nr:helix-turn-helix transcriptional regulator [Bacillus pseudomycoides]MCR8860352.1 helix-turn-helix transcriptional regulator [Bacillus pseudomycoides]